MAADPIIGLRDDRKIDPSTPMDQVIEKMFSGSTELFNLAKSIHDKDDDTSYVSFLTRSNEYDSMLLLI